MVAERLGKTAVLDAANRMAIELGKPLKVTSIVNPPELLVEENPSAEKAVEAFKTPTPARVARPASPDPLTGEIQTREPARRPEHSLHIKTLGKAAFDNMKPTTKVS